MGNSISISITGMPELKRKLAQLSDAVAGEKLENAVVAGALLIKNAAQANAPYLTGNLRRSIHIGGHVVEGGEMGNTAQSDLTEVLTKTGKSYTKKRYKGSAGTDIGGNVSSRNSAEVLVGTNVDYAFSIEYGADGRPAKPYLRPALDTNRGAVVKEVGEALADLLRGVTG